MTSLVLCRCGLAKHTVAVEGPTVAMVVLECEHCDRPCEQHRCEQCRTASRQPAP